MKTGRVTLWRRTLGESPAGDDDALVGKDGGIGHGELA